MNNPWTACILANEKSGSAPDDALDWGLARAGRQGRLQILSHGRLHPDELANAAQETVAHAPDLIVVTGGDGTIRTVAEAMVGSSSRLLALPCGTVNIVARRLFGDRSADQVLDVLDQCRPASLHAGWLNDRLFLVSAMIGFPVAAANARELVRDGMPGQLAEAVRATGELLTKTREADIDIEGHGAAAGLLATLGDCGPLFGRAAQGEPIDGLTALAVRPHGALDWARILADAIASDWRQADMITQLDGDRFTAHCHDGCRVVLDGEAMQADNPMIVRFAPDAVPALRLPRNPRRGPS